MYSSKQFREMIKQVYKFLNPSFQNLFLEYRVCLKPRYGHGAPPHPGLYRIINANRDFYRELLKRVYQYRDRIVEIKDIADESDNNKPAWNNGFLPGMDMVAIYLMLAEFKPGRYIEVGSGYSTRVAYKAIKDLGLKTEIISIDPQPRSGVEKLAGRIIKKPLENVEMDIPGMLGKNDILFMDGSHRILPNSDCMVFFMEILPELQKGTIVHIHDIYIPYDYPQVMCDRFYSEQYGLAAYLLANPARFEILLPNWFISEDTELAAILDPLWVEKSLRNVERHGGSFWFRVS